jgi:hypothetical protein
MYERTSMPAFDGIHGPFHDFGDLIESQLFLVMEHDDGLMIGVQEPNGFC